ncbi:MAG: hypothetical protein D4S01_04040 [Dehalococcoidia bacterium]|nr:MAG: hypothetical protein D4S01_04040 [Dehalococcoidia bacterium]
MAISVKADFFKTFHFLPAHETNHLNDKIRRKDIILFKLSEKVFDSPILLKLLMFQSRQWLKREKTELAFSIAGYAHYLDRQYRRAVKFFLKSIEKNPLNVDNWFDLAFSLYHSDGKDLELSKAIIFDHDFFIDYYHKLNIKKCSRKTIEKIHTKIQRSKKK